MKTGDYNAAILGADDIDDAQLKVEGVLDRTFSRKNATPFPDGEPIVGETYRADGWRYVETVGCPEIGVLTEIIKKVVPEFNTLDGFDALIEHRDRLVVLGALFIVNGAAGVSHGNFKALLNPALTGLLADYGRDVLIVDAMDTLN